MSALGTELKMSELSETGGSGTFGLVGSMTEFDPSGPTFAPPCWPFSATVSSNGVGDP
jgi:hypothetical protein